ncbi:unnamed protein product [Cyprideis torosa]|uniref:Uncharacterized protein n=1 Tax=Cyprideis torosa TaxID=163714 RepID=A0A7R8WX58_9CRUS|nr:unnamed protein product [Cyprideis torosa]CAG0910774.1 unnamed protein product [Cyprideis torosa]
MAEVDSRNLSGVDSPRQIVFEAAKDFGRLFYITDLSETTFEDVTIVPHYVQRSFPYFVLLIFLEAIVRKIQGKPTIRVNDAVGSLSAGFCLEISE